MNQELTMNEKNAFTKGLQCVISRFGVYFYHLSIVSPYKAAIRLCNSLQHLYLRLFESINIYRNRNTAIYSVEGLKIGKNPHQNGVKIIVLRSLA